MIENYSGGNEIPIGPTMQLDGQQAPQMAPGIIRGGLRRMGGPVVNAQPKNFHIDIRVNKEKKEFLVFVNGTRVLQQADSREFAGKGRFLRIHCSSTSSVAMRISHLSR